MQAQEYLQAVSTPDATTEIVGIVVFFVGLLVIIIVTCCCVSAGCKVVHQASVMVVERWGKFHRVLKPGLHFLIPFVDRPRKIHWRFVSVPVGQNQETVVSVVTDRISLQTHCIDFGKQNVITKDTVPISIDALVYFRILSPQRAVYSIQSLPDAIELLTQTTLRNIIAYLTLDDCFSSRERINDLLRERTQSDAARWGVEIVAVEIQQILPPDDIKAAMENQIIGERERRSAVLQADGERESQVIRSRGDAAKVVLHAEGEKMSRIQTAKGEAEYKMVLATSEAECITALREALTQLGSQVRATDYLVCLQYLNALHTSTSSKPSKVVLIPRSSLETVSQLLKPA